MVWDIILVILKTVLDVCCLVWHSKWCFWIKGVIRRHVSWKSHLEDYSSSSWTCSTKSQCELLFKFICILYKWESFFYWRAQLLREPFLGPKSGPFCRTAPFITQNHYPNDDTDFEQHKRCPKLFFFSFLRFKPT